MTDELEIYKLHAELADRVSQRREAANRLYVSIVVGLVVFASALLRFSEGGNPDAVVIFGIGLCGVLLSASWFIVLRSYRQLNSNKFRVLHDLETRLPYQFFTEEERDGHHMRLTIVETTLPLLFGLLFLGMLGYSIQQ